MKARLKQITASFERLSAREQIMVLFLVLTLVGMFVAFTGYFVRRDLKAKERRIAVKVEKLKEIAAARTDYQRRLAEQERLAQEVGGNRGTRILTYLEELGKKAKIELGNAAERTGEPTGSELVKEEAAEIMVNNVSLDRLFEFLREIEEGNRLVKIRRLKIKTRFDNKEMLDAAITVGTYKPTKET